MPSPSTTTTPSSKIPPLLEQNLVSGPAATDAGSLTLLTSVQGASTNWLVLRYVLALVQQADVGVLVVSFLRDGPFWRDGGLRIGLNMDAMIKTGKIGIVDGLTGLFTGDASPTGNSSDVILKSPALEDINAQIDAATERLQTSKKVLIVDGLDALVAMAPEGASSSSLSAEKLILSLRERAFSTIFSVAADAPLIQQQHTTLEKTHAALVLGQAHAADEVVSLRRLDTGAAADVSGVMRIDGVREGREVLYYVAADGGVRVFERGA